MREALEEIIAWVDDLKRFAEDEGAQPATVFQHARAVLRKWGTP